MQCVYSILEKLMNCYIYRHGQLQYSSQIQRYGQIFKNKSKLQNSNSFPVMMHENFFNWWRLILRNRYFKLSFIKIKQIIIKNRNYILFTFDKNNPYLRWIKIKSQINKLHSTVQINIFPRFIQEWWSYKKRTIDTLYTQRIDNINKNEKQTFSFCEQS